MGSLKSERRHVAHEPPLLCDLPSRRGWCVLTTVYFHGKPAASLHRLRGASGYGPTSATAGASTAGRFIFVRNGSLSTMPVTRADSR